MDHPEIIAPIATYTVTYGLDQDGDLALNEEWTNHENSDRPVPMMIKAGMITLAQQSLTLDCLPTPHDDEDD